MANFETHLSGGATLAALAAVIAHGYGWATPVEALALFAVGLFASLAPDIDLDHSTAARVFFFALGLLLGLFAVFALKPYFAPLGLALAWLFVWLTVRYPLAAVFGALTVHRGMWHSLAMALTVALAVAASAAHLLGQPAPLAWLAGGFALLGYLTHLVLDELASVDLLNRRVKRSVGSALKPLSLSDWPSSALVLVVLFGLLRVSPDPAPLVLALHRCGLDGQTLRECWPPWPPSPGESGARSTTRHVAPR